MTQATRPNWFVGFPLVDAWVPRAIAGIPTGLRTFWGDDIHITIAFLGPCGEDAAWAGWRQFVDGESPMVGGEPAFTLELGAIEPFGPASRPSSLAVVPSEPHNPAAEFIDRYRNGIRVAAGLTPDHRPARPHATVARIPRNATPAFREAAVLWARSAPKLAERVHVDSVALFARNEAPSEMLYGIVARRQIGGPR